MEDNLESSIIQHINGLKDLFEEKIKNLDVKIDFLRNELLESSNSAKEEIGKIKSRVNKLETSFNFVKGMVFVIGGLLTFIIVPLVYKFLEMKILEK